MKVRKSLLFALAAGILLVASIVRAQLRQPDVRSRPDERLGARAPVPARVMSMLRQACFDCHSDETRWPWYSGLPPVSWLLERDVEGGRNQLDFSRWTQYNPFDRAGLLDKACELVTSGEMPLRPYRLLHPEARLSKGDIDALCAWARTEATRLVEGGSE